jgi:hypothetical protein
MMKTIKFIEATRYLSVEYTIDQELTLTAQEAQALVDAKHAVFVDDKAAKPKDKE